MPLTAIKVIDVTDPAYGAVGNGIANDTLAIKTAVNDYYNYLNSATDGIIIYTQPVLYFPKGIYMVNQKIDLKQPLNDKAGYTFSIMGDDAIIIAGAAFDDYAFFHDRCYDVKIEGLNFLNFKKGVYLGNNDGPINPVTGKPDPEHLDTCQFSVTSCSFQNCDEALGIYGLSAIANIEKCKFYMNKVAVNIKSGDKVIMRDNWITSGIMSGTRPAQILNTSVLIFESNVLVPMPPAEGTLEPAWINNYHTVKVTDARQGAEDGSFTLINNFAGSVPPISGQDATAIYVKDSYCCAIYGNNDNASPRIIQPAVVRYVTKIPNSTVIRNNGGLIECTLIDFSYDLYYKPGHTGNIEDVFTNSGAAVVPHSYVEVANNAGGIMYDHGSYLPLPLYPLVRSDESLWPSKRSNELKLISVAISSVNTTDDTITYTFDYGDNFDVTHLVNYTGDPNQAGTGGFHWYSGGFVGLLKANGYNKNGSGLMQSLILEPIFNQISDPNTSGGDYPASSAFTVDAYWDFNGSKHLPYLQPNHKFCIKVTGRSGNAGYDTIKVTPLNAL